ncbi:MAG: glycosyltransferase family 4 protein, partial [Verrucomicrobiota bacterium]
VDPTLIDVFPNGYDPVLLPTDTRARIRSEHGWGDQFVAIFVGTHVEVTAIDTIVKAASMLHGRPDIRFELFGKGQQKAAAIQLARNLDLRNIHFNDPVPKAVVPELLAGADAALMTLFKSPLINIYFENKLVDYLGAGKPILAAMDGMQSELIARNRAGLTVASLDYQGLARIVAYAADHPAEARQLGANGHAVACQHLLLTTILDHYAQALRHVAYGRSAQLPVWKPAV